MPILKLRRQALAFTLSHENSLNLDGTTETVFNSTPTVLNFGNAFTVSLWWKGPGASASTSDTLFQIGTNAGGSSVVTLAVKGILTNDPIRLSLVDSGSVTFKQYDYESLLTSSWAMWTVSWDGATAILYKNGIAQTPTTITTDIAGTMIDEPRLGSVGCDTLGVFLCPGNFHSLAIWNVALDSAEISRLYNGGDGSTFSAQNIRNSNMAQYILLGFTGSDRYHNNITSYNIGQDEANITAADVDVDAP